jgi:WD40 repeat protein
MIGVALQRTFAVRHVAPVTAVSFSPDGRKLLTAKNTGFLATGWAWTIHQIGEERERAGGRQTRYRRRNINDAVLVVGDDGLAVATAGNDKAVRVFRGILPEPRRARVPGRVPRPTPWRVTQTIRHSGEVNALAACQGRGQLLTASSDGEAKLVDLGSGEIVNVFRHSAPVTAIAMSPDGEVIASGGGRRRDTPMDSDAESADDHV